MSESEEWTNENVENSDDDGDGEYERHINGGASSSRRSNKNVTNEAKIPITYTVIPVPVERQLLLMPADTVLTTLQGNIDESCTIETLLHDRSDSSKEAVEDGLRRLFDNNEHKRP